MIKFDRNNKIVQGSTLYSPFINTEDNNITIGLLEIGLEYGINGEHSSYTSDVEFISLCRLAKLTYKNPALVHLNYENH